MFSSTSPICDYITWYLRASHLTSVCETLLLQHRWSPNLQNADPDVRKDMETFLSKVAVPEVRQATLSIRSRCPEPGCKVQGAIAMMRNGDAALPRDVWQSALCNILYASRGLEHEPH